MEEKIHYQISSSMNNEILEIVVTGGVTETNLESALNEGNAIIKSSNAKKALVDFRAFNTGLDPSEFYRYARNYYFAIFEIQYAVVDLPENLKYRDAAIRAGLKSLEWFTDIDAAREWLKSTY
jgi:hypothetical protein